MRALFRCKRGLTIIELIVSISLFVVLVGGMITIFITTNKICVKGTDKVEAKQLLDEVYQNIEIIVSKSDNVTLKNTGFKNKNIVSIDNKIMFNGSSLVEYDSRLVFVRIAFTKEGEYVMGLSIEVLSPYESVIYTESKSILLKNLQVKGQKINVQEDASQKYTGIDFS